MKIKDWYEEFGPLGPGPLGPFTFSPIDGVLSYLKATRRPEPFDWWRYLRDYEDSQEMIEY
jgi:hypothetical protein